LLGASADDREGHRALKISFSRGAHYWAPWVPDFLLKDGFLDILNKTYRTPGEVELWQTVLRYS
jgi:hypothetical protein